MPRAGAIALLALTVLALPLSAAAQRTTGEIIGTVVDGSGSVLPGVSVTLRGAAVAGAPVSVSSEPCTSVTRKVRGPAPMPLSATK